MVFFGRPLLRFLEGSISVPVWFFRISPQKKAALLHSVAVYATPTDVYVAPTDVFRGFIGRQVGQPFDLFCRPDTTQGRSRYVGYTRRGGTRNIRQ